MSGAMVEYGPWKTNNHHTNGLLCLQMKKHCHLHKSYFSHHGNNRNATNMFFVFVQLLLLELILRFMTVGAIHLKIFSLKWLCIQLMKISNMLRLLHLIGVIAVFTPFSNNVLSWETIENQATYRLRIKNHHDELQIQHTFSQSQLLKRTMAQKCAKCVHICT